MRVGRDTDTAKLAQSIARCVQDSGHAMVRACGEKPIHRMTSAIAAAESMIGRTLTDTHYEVVQTERGEFTMVTCTVFPATQIHDAMERAVKTIHELEAYIGCLNKPNGNQTQGPIANEQTR